MLRLDLFATNHLHMEFICGVAASDNSTALDAKAGGFVSSA
jgi:hypothetical protein